MRNAWLHHISLLHNKTTLELNAYEKNGVLDKVEMML